MAKNTKNDSQYNKARGRRDGSAGKPKDTNRERNIGHSKGEEHSVKPKGGAGNWSKGRG